MGKGVQNHLCCRLEIPRGRGRRPLLLLGAHPGTGMLVQVLSWGFFLAGVRGAAGAREVASAAHEIHPDPEGGSLGLERPVGGAGWLDTGCWTQTSESQGPEGLRLHQAPRWCRCCRPGSP